MDIKLTHAQGNQILQYLGTGIRMPAKFGVKDGEDFDFMQRATGDEEMGKVRSLLMTHSEMWALKRKVLFGKAANWKETKNEKGQEVYELQNEDEVVTLKLSEDQERGLFWILMLMAHPASPVPVAIQALNDVVWPLAEQLGYRNDLRDMTGLAKRKPVRQLRRDSDPSWAKDKKADDKTVDLGDKKLAEAAKA